MIPDWLSLAFWAIAVPIWLYLVARLVTAAILRSIRERKNHHGQD